MWSTVALLIFALVLSGCGGGDDDPSPALGHALIAAARAGDPERVHALLAGAAVNAKDETGQGAYLIATSEVGDDPRLLELTLANGADVDAKDSYNGTSLIRAADRGYVRIVERLARDRDRDRPRQPARLDAAALGDHPRRRRPTPHRRCSPARRRRGRRHLADAEGVTPLAHARSQGFDEIAAILERAGARA